MTCCAVGPCANSRARGGVGCYLCDVVANLPQPKPPPDERRRKDDTRDGVAASKGGAPLAFKRRHRVGPHR